MKETVVLKREREIQLDSIEPLTINDYPWYEGGFRQGTRVKLMYDDEALCIHVEAEDCHSSASVLSDNGPVYLDSCFEFFFTPESQLKTSYINLEINCIGSVYLAVRDSNDKRRATSEEIGRIRVETSLEQGVKKSPDSKDHQWSLDIKLPFDFIQSFYKEEISRKRWYCNFYRCGGVIDDQYAVWNKVMTEGPDFHQPMQFGQLEFG